MFHRTSPCSLAYWCLTATPFVALAIGVPPLVVFPSYVSQYRCLTYWYFAVSPLVVVSAGTVYPSLDILTQSAIFTLVVNDTVVRWYLARPAREAPFTRALEAILE